MTVQTHQDIFNCIEKWAPKKLAYDWDPVGLQTGSFQDQTGKVLVSLDVTEAVADEAIAKGANLIIAHHPLLFKPLKHIDISSQQGKIIRKLIKHDITVYASHTNLDIAQGGVNDMLGDRLSLQHLSPLAKTGAEALLKLVVHVPQTHTAVLREGLGDAGAGYIGAYSHCMFSTPGTGTFVPQDGTTPYLGKKNELTFAHEDQLETIIKEKDTAAILDKLNELHPYEEVAYDLYPVKQTAETYGIGRIGTLPETVTLANLCETVKQEFEIDHLRFVGDRDKRVEKVSVIGGSGEKYVAEAINSGSDVLITGDVSFHIAQEAQEMGLSIIDPGHYIEKIMKNGVKDFLETEIPNLDVIQSAVNTEPFSFM